MSNASDFVIENGVLTKYTGEDTNVIIPEGVTEIGNDALRWQNKIVNIMIPDSVKSIGDKAFSRCSYLKQITMPGGITKIKNGTFSDCGSLESILIPEGVTEIGDSAFEGCFGLTDITVPERVKRIGKSAFSGCTGIKTLKLPDGLETVERDAFFACSNLVEITMPLAAISDKMFGGNGKTIIMTLTQPGKEPVRVVASFRKDYWSQTWTYPKEYLIPITEEAIDYYDKLLASGSYDGFSINEDGRIRGAFWRIADKTFPMRQELLPAVAEFLSAKLTKALKLAEQDKAASYIQTLVNIGAINDTNRKKAEKTLAKSEVPEIKAMVGNLVPVMQPVEEDNFDPIEPVFRERLKKLQATSILLKYGVDSLPEVQTADGTGIAPADYLRLILAEYLIDAPNNTSFIPLADEAAEKLDKVSLRRALRTIYDGTVNEKHQLMLMFPLFRYADGNTVREVFPKTYSVKWKADAAKNALLLNDSRDAMLYADKYHLLERYAAKRRTEADVLRDTVLSDFGFDEEGKKTYDLGSGTVSVTVGKDLSLQIFDDQAGKIAKSIPKKDADPKKYEEAKADFAELKKNIKKAAKGRSDLLFEAFLFGVAFRSDAWKSVYTKNPVLNAVARLIVWAQDDRTFTLSDCGAIDSAEQPYTITDEKIKVAHPMQMKLEDITAWQKYFTLHDLKQPFAQVWEPVRHADEIKKDRYRDCMIPYYRFLNQEKHGIYVEDHDYHNDINISLMNCETEIERIDWKRHEINPNDRFEIKSFTFKTYTRQVNHLVAYFDRITVWDRVRKDDLTVIDQLDRFTLAQITDFISAAQEANANNVLAALLDYKNTHFADFDPMTVFTLDW